MCVRVNDCVRWRERWREAVLSLILFLSKNRTCLYDSVAANSAGGTEPRARDGHVSATIYGSKMLVHGGWIGRKKVVRKMERVARTDGIS